MDPQNQPQPEHRSRGWLFLLLIPVVIIAFLLFFGGSGSKSEMKYSELIGYFHAGQVQEFDLSFDTGTVKVLLREEVRQDTDKDGKITEKDVFTYKLASISLFYEDISETLENVNTDEDTTNDIIYDFEPEKQVSWLISMLPTLLMIAATVALFWFMMRRLNQSMGGDGKMGGFAKARTKKPTDDKRKVTFDHVAGADEEKAELQEIVDFLKSPKKYKELGARVPKGVLLVGPPGTGKTLLARAVAGEAGVPFFSISGSDFVEMYVGVGASRVRDLFDTAKKSAPCIIFVDEIDAVGRERGAGLGGGHDEREQTLNQLLVEMDGFGANEGIIMIAATNRPDILDPALTRPGRFDRQIVVHYPDVKGREEILKVHAKGKPLAPDVELAVIAKTTVGFTGADLENLLNEAALLAARRNLHSITMREIEDATVKVICGTEKTSHKVTERDKRITAYHEAGHAVVTYYCPTQDPVHEISIIPRGMAAGYTLNLPKTDDEHLSRGKMLEKIQVLLGGRAAEALTQEDICTGASNDIERASEIARKMVTKYGMSEKLGPILFGDSADNGVFLGRSFGQNRNYSEAIAAEIDAEVSAIIHGAYAAAEGILKEHADQLKLVAEYLIRNEKVDEATFVDLMTGKITLDEEA